MQKKRGSSVFLTIAIIVALLLGSSYFMRMMLPQQKQYTYSEILYFFADRDHIYAMSEYLEDGEVQSYSVEDEEGKYFVRPPKTQWELQMEEMQNQRSKDLPF